MNTLELIQSTLDIGSLFIFFSTLLLILEKYFTIAKIVRKLGSLGTSIGCLCYIASGYLAKAYFMVIVSIVTSIYWLLNTIRED